jgi:undecaprenyl-diphosphatase
MDDALLRALRTRGHSPRIENATRRLSFLGEHGALWLVLAALGALLDRGRRAFYGRAAATIGGAYVTNQVLKIAVRRRRPVLADLPPLIHTASQMSYPSAHATTSFAGARALSGVWPAAPLYALATMMTLSRPYLGVHYPTDVAAGAALGAAIAELRS